MSVRRLCSTTAASANLGRRVNIFGAVVISRFPVVAPPMAEVEKRYSEQVLQVESENSLRSDFELRSIRDRKLIARKEQLEAEGKDLSELEGELSFTAEMQEDEWLMKSSEVKAKYDFEKPLETVADLQSLKRCLDRKLVLIVKQKLHHRSDDYRTPWIIPQRKNEGETLRETVEQCIGDLFEGVPKISVMGNAPFASYRYRYPRKVKDAEKANEAEIFFFDAHIHSWNDPVFKKATVSDYMWCTPEELLSNLARRDYKNRLKTALFE
ncbi:hypothetical protein QR680_009363 [Steinernema hermaphroditum]|uniref:Large ribosomal subunit protein mL46 N-terminal domain-containing protein n=1 Tax=Steinernema hermaphroditum TaxID=289476 RepID=A0AA39IJZ3_9BILA|nr:hypothetical protein QR680_009363 [Steinernema hermaphroditum]